MNLDLIIPPAREQALLSDFGDAERRSRHQQPDPVQRTPETRGMARNPWSQHIAPARPCADRRGHDRVC